MKYIKYVFIITAIALLITGCGNGENRSEGLHGTITISGAWALYPMTVKWAEEFRNIHPNVYFDISAGGAGKGMADVLSGAVDIGNVSREVYAEEIERGAYIIPVTRDAVVPTFNANNPNAEGILSQGLSQEEFIDIWVNGNISDWKECIECNSDSQGNSPINVYTRSDACGAAKTWALYLNASQDELKGIGVFGDPGLTEAVIRDKNGIGYNNINYAYDSKSGMPIEGIIILPIDINSNGRIDEEENIYNTRNDIINAIAEGIYPSPPARDLYFITNGKPENELLVEFINWVLTEGQQYVPDAGYIKLSDDCLQNTLDAMNE